MGEQTPIAYFCAEFGVRTDLPWYAGGLGILAGDTLKQAAESTIPMVGVGLLYRGDGFIQRINAEGLQEEVSLQFDPVAAGLEHVYVDEMPLFIRVHLTELDVWVRCWKYVLSDSVQLYLLDTDTEQNQLSERSITHLLYSGTEESVLKQQLILGIGGVKLLHALNIFPKIYHVQEGRPAFLHWQLLRYFMSVHGLTYQEAVQAARERTVYTNHTLVGAGNPSCNLHMLKRYAQYYADKMGISVDELVSPGVQPQEPDRFFQTLFALKTSRIASGVSAPHTLLSKQQWPNFTWQSTTNGVHKKTWQAPAFENISDATDATLWQYHQEEKLRTMQYVQQKTGFQYDPNALIITWARRLAGYKRMDALFQDVGRLKALLSNAERPVQILVSGKAHRLDTSGKQLLQHIIHVMAHELSGHVLFVPDYSIEVAQHLVRGSDVWLNTPEIGKEACGTSGMKAMMNGVLQVTVPDGWAAEVSWQDKGWELDSARISDSCYETLTQQVIPLFFNRPTGVPEGWVKRMRAGMLAAEHFSAQRMLHEYSSLLYQLQ